MCGHSCFSVFSYIWLGHYLDAQKSCQQKSIAYRFQSKDYYHQGRSVTEIWRSDETKNLDLLGMKLQIGSCIHKKPKYRHM